MLTNPWIWVIRIFFFLGMNLNFNIDLVTGIFPIELDPRQPCDHKKAIALPESGQCLVPVMSAYNWTKAQDFCESARGTLFKMPLTFQVSHRNLLDCLSSMEKPVLTQVWLNPITELLPQFRWLNGSALTPMEHCTPEMPPAILEGPLGTGSTMDACVAHCHQAAAKYAFVLNQRRTSRCYCANQLNDAHKLSCDSFTFSFRNTTYYFIAQASAEPLIEIPQIHMTANGENLCAAIKTNNTVQDQSLKSYPCFHRLRFICDLGNETDCPQKLCDGVNCIVPWRDTCLRLVDHPLNWYEAGAFCNVSGGVLWQMDSLPVILELNQQVPYWIGASNFLMINNTNGVSLAKFSANFQRVRCASMQRTQGHNSWRWHFTSCDQRNSFLCQFDTDTPETKETFQCPWVVGSTSTPLDIPYPAPPTTVFINQSDDSFPVAALLSALVAAIILLVCLTGCCAFCCQRRTIMQYEDYKKNVFPVPLAPSYVSTISKTRKGIQHSSSTLAMREERTQTGNQSQSGKKHSSNKSNGHGTSKSRCDTIQDNDLEMKVIRKSTTASIHTNPPSQSADDTIVERENRENQGVFTRRDSSVLTLERTLMDNRTIDEIQVPVNTIDETKIYVV